MKGKIYTIIFFIMSPLVFIAQENKVLDQNKSVENFIRKLEKICLEKDTTQLYGLLSKNTMGSGINYGGGRLKLGTSDDDQDIFKSFFSFSEGDTIFWTVLLEMIQSKSLHNDNNTVTLGVLENPRLQKNIMLQDSSLFLEKATSGSVWVSLNESNKLYELPDLNSKIRPNIAGQVLTAYDSTNKILELKLFENSFLWKDWIFVRTLNATNEGWMHKSLLYNVSNCKSIFFSFKLEKESWKLHFYSF